MSSYGTFAKVRYIGLCSVPEKSLVTIPRAVKHLLFWLVLAILICVSIESLSLLSLYILKKVNGVVYWPIQVSLSDKHIRIVTKILAGQTSYYQHDPMLGWSIKQNGSGDNLYRANSAGIRADREYRLIPPQDILRIASFGDSFTHCDDVVNQHTWQTFLAEILPNTEVMNFGVASYGLDQAFLRFERDGKKYQPHIVMIGFMSEDIYRHVNVFRPFLFPGTRTPLAKPRFLLRSGDLVLQDNPLQHLTDLEILLRKPHALLPSLSAYDWHFQQKPKRGQFDFLASIRLIRLVAHQVRIRSTPQPKYDGAYNQSSEAFKLTLRIFDEFYRSVTREGARALIVLFPNKHDLERYRISDKNVFEPLISHFREAGYLFVDLHEAFDTFASDVPLNKLFVGHYSPAANKVVARYLSYSLVENGLVDRPEK
jgi:hypothetical protein